MDDFLRGLHELVTGILKHKQLIEIGWFKDKQVTISTTKITEGRQPFETGIKHPWYNEGNWIIVEAYDTETEAKEGHQRWIKIMTASELPEHLRDCGNSRLIASIEGAYFFPKIKGRG